VLDIHSMLAGFGAYIDYNEIDARWVAKIADAFRRAGGDGSVNTLPDAAIRASLRSAGLLGGRQSVTFDDPVAYGMPPTTGYANDPVNTASGNFVELEDDLPFIGLLSGLRFARMYNSRSDASGAFGSGWSSWADTRLHARPGARDIRVNQQQVNAAGERVGINRPDLQYTLDGKRHYVEYEGEDNPRGAAHEARIRANDPKARFRLEKVD
jgi:hypothetical protein